MTQLEITQHTGITSEAAKYRMRHWPQERWLEPRYTRVHTPPQYNCEYRRKFGASLVELAREYCTSSSNISIITAITRPNTRAELDKAVHQWRQRCTK